MSNFSVTKSKLILGLVFIIILLISSLMEILSEVIGFDSGIFKRDLIVITLVLLLSLGSRECQLDLGLMCSAIVGYLFADAVNAFTDFKPFSPYLNYNSVKCLAVLPLFYFVAKQKYWTAMCILLPTVLLLNAYGTRMIVLSSLIILFLAAIIEW